MNETGGRFVRSEPLSTAAKPTDAGRPSFLYARGRTWPHL
jgi:hypothetical protein